MKKSASVHIVPILMSLMLMNGLTSHVIINPLVLDAAGRDAWLSVIFATVLLVPWTLMLAVFMKRTGQQKIQPWLAEKTTPVLSWILVAPLIIHLYLIGGVTLYHTSGWTISNYLPATPKIVLVGTLMFVCFYMAKLGIRSIAVSAGILLPIVVILGFFVSISNVMEKNFNLLAPILEHGIMPPVNGMIYVGGGFVEIFVILSMQHRITNRVKPWHMAVYGLIISYITLGPILGAISEFGPQEAAKQMESPYEQWRLVKIGKYVEHVDFLSVYQWLAGAFMRIALAQYLLVEILPFKSRVMANRFLLAVSFSYVLFAMFPVSQDAFYQGLYRYYFPISLCVNLLLSVIWTAITFLPAKRKEEAS
ncbi:endospore germination permease [Paenibacillus cookii]|uniref:Germination protein n=1 Tax=Paenibacillus cookii TaxID=157839 RepID=A0ABQ4LRU7_9BACL|nr:endospore germination permease [Paenibacillus cookii]GIO65975.1 germination protein [Paenibacillus cookii]